MLVSRSHRAIGPSGRRAGDAPSLKGLLLDVE